MNLFLVRHGIAEDAGPAVDDRSRALTPEGVQKLHLQARAMKRAGIEPDAVVSSPLVRAVQTADVLAKHFSIQIEQDRLLAPGCRLSDLQELLGRRTDRSDVMIVGHEPDFGWLVRELTGANVKMRKGAVAVVRLGQAEAASGQLRGLYDPDVMAMLGA